MANDSFDYPNAGALLYKDDTEVSGEELLYRIIGGPHDPDGGGDGGTWFEIATNLRSNDSDGKLYVNRDIDPSGVDKNKWCPFETLDEAKKSDLREKQLGQRLEGGRRKRYKKRYSKKRRSKKRYSKKRRSKKRRSKKRRSKKRY